MMIDTCARHWAAGEAFSDALRRFARLMRKYAEDQPRVPAGSPEGGQWTSGGSGLADFVDQLGEAVARLPSLLFAGEFGKEDMGKTVQEFVAEKCRGEIYSVLPSQFLEWTIQELSEATKAIIGWCSAAIKFFDRIGSENEHDRYRARTIWFAFVLQLVGKTRHNIQHS